MCVWRFRGARSGSGKTTHSALYRSSWIALNFGQYEGVRISSPSSSMNRGREPFCRVMSSSVSRVMSSLTLLCPGGNHGQPPGVWKGHGGVRVRFAGKGWVEVSTTLASGAAW